MANISPDKKDSQDSTGIGETVIGSTVDATQFGIIEVMNNDIKYKE